MLRLKRPLRPSSNVDPEDALATKLRLADLGFYEPPTGEFHGWPDAELFAGVRKAQEFVGETPDGEMLPGGPTEAALNRLTVRPSLKSQESNDDRSAAASSLLRPDETASDREASLDLRKRRSASRETSAYRDPLGRDGARVRFELAAAASEGEDGVRAGALPPKQPPAPGEKPLRLLSPGPGAVFRGADVHGSGAYHASRDGGARRHKGVDIALPPGAEVASVASGVVTHLGYAYRNDRRYRTIEVTTPYGYKVKHLYVLPDTRLKLGDAVVAGRTPVGSMQDIGVKYPGITNHVHVVVIDPRKEIDPTPLFFGVGRK